MDNSTAKTSWIIGRAEDCDLIVSQPTDGGHHCRLTMQNDGFVLVDLDSTNGTYINGTRIAPREPVRLSYWIDWTLKAAPLCGRMHGHQAGGHAG